MGFINYFLAGLISFSGLILGIILISIAPEEQKPGKKYFILMQNILFVLIIFFFLFYLQVNLFIFLAVIILTTYFLRIKTKNNFIRSFLIYFALGVVFFLSSVNLNLFLIESVLIFLSGMPTSSLLFDNKKKNYFRVVFSNIVFLVTALFLFLIFYFI